MKKKFYCIGDSHASFFSGLDAILPLSPETKNRYSFFEAYRLGAILAYNIAFYNTSSKGREKFEELLMTKIPKNATLILVFGEIDCRVHIVKQAKLMNTSIDEIAKNVVKRYSIFINHLKNQGFKIIVWAVVPTSSCDTQNKEYPNNGSLLERTQATLIFNNSLEEYCIKEGIRFLSIYKYIVDKDGVMLKKYFIDCVHLSQKALKFLFYELELSLNYYLKYGCFLAKDYLFYIKKRLVSLLKWISVEFVKPR
jgi:hypothetical protein